MGWSSRFEEVLLRSTSAVGALVVIVLVGIVVDRAEAQSCPACQESRLPAGNPGLTRGEALDGGSLFTQAALRYSNYIDKRDVRHSNTSILLSLSAQISAEVNVSVPLPYHFLNIAGHKRPHPSH